MKSDPRGVASGVLLRLVTGFIEKEYPCAYKCKFIINFTDMKGV